MMKMPTIAPYLLMGLIMSLPLSGFAQEPERLIDKMSWRTEPIKILKIRTKNKNVELGKNFSEEDDWLRGLTVTVENISNKAIARIELQLAFPRLGGGSREKPILMAGMIYGREPDISTQEVPKLVPPGESVNISLLEVNLPFIKADLEKLGYPEKILHAQISVRSVTFVDGSEWAGDDMLYPDPNNPKRKINPQSLLTKSRYSQKGVSP